MLRFLDGHLLGTTSHAGDAAGGGGGGDNAAFLASLPEPMRGHDGFKDVKDVGDLATRYHRSLTTPFADQLPADIKGDAAFKDIKDLGGLAKSYLSSQRMIGIPAERRLAIPQDDKPESWNEVYAKLGRPEKADGYQIPALADGKQYSEADKTFQTKLMPVLHEVGLSQRQINALVPKWNGIMAEYAMAEQNATQQRIAAGDAELTKTWGAAKDEKLSLAKGAISFFAGPGSPLKLGKDLQAALELKGSDGKSLGDLPAVSELMAYLGQTMREDRLIGKGGGGGEGTPTPTEAEQQINALYADNEFMKAYNNKKHPGHADAVMRMQKLFEAKTAVAAE